MATPLYAVGTATLTAGQTAMVGQTTLWLGNVRPYDMVIGQDGSVNLVLTVNSNTSITLLFPWAGATQTAQPYRILYTADDPFTQTLVRQVMQTLAASALVALGGLVPTARQGVYFDAVANAALFSLTDFARTLLDDADAATARTTLGAQAALGYTPVNKAGDSGVGTTSFTNIVNVGFFSATGVSAGFNIAGSSGRLNVSTNSPTTQGLIGFYNPNGNVGFIATTGSATSYSTSSDYRLKTDIEPLVEFTLSGDQFDLVPDALLRVLALRPVRHKWLADPNGPSTHGFVAHEAQIVVPHAVVGEKDAEVDIGNIVTPDKTIITDATEDEVTEGSAWTKTGTRPLYQGIDPSKIVADLTAGLQALTVLVLEQQAQIAALTPQSE
ncbi:tail fiber domain-containing protein [Mesorhizobium sp. CA13]|uniref:tail fiber domain-containing protein n=1 Tax=Mesorhizobium sp. CA13 TaxID=2876643 RepID=UPI001CC99823|nr:tail fiber domain-containing protein [Mesorhizobium sp. CA13]MBZ9852786.1 tail fiber domain-containing protein [Mesorhizobium sp. CA13]